MGKTKKDVMTDPILQKGGPHTRKRPAPVVCSTCGGIGIETVDVDGFYWREEECSECGGSGTIYHVEKE